jgi:hypothetical protein
MLIITVIIQRINSHKVIIKRNPNMMMVVVVVVVVAVQNTSRSVPKIHY